jgi:predicted ATPase
MKEASGRSQVFVSTHNSIFLKSVELSNIILVSRQNAGDSQISRPVDKKEVSVFMKNNLGVDDLFVMNLL